MNTKSIVYIALFAALTSAFALFPPLTIPGIGIPITAQSLGVMLAGALAGDRCGAMAMVLFLVLVAVGLPLMSGGRGGISIFLGPSGGFLLAWPISAFVIGWLLGKYPNAGLFPSIVCIAFGGIVVMYAIGIPWFAIATKIHFIKAFTGSMVFLVGDLIKAIIAALIIRGVLKAYPNP